MFLFCFSGLLLYLNPALIGIDTLQRYCGGIGMFGPL